MLLTVCNTTLKSISSLTAIGAEAVDVKLCYQTTMVLLRGLDYNTRSSFLLVVLDGEGTILLRSAGSSHDSALSRIVALNQAEELTKPLLESRTCKNKVNRTMTLHETT